MDSFEDICPEEAARLIDANACYVLDVRTAGEFALHRIDGAHLLPVQELQIRHAEIPRIADKKILVYCEHGVRSVGTCQILVQNGWKNLLNMTGGMAAWLDAGLPVSRGAQVYTANRWLLNKDLNSK